MTEQAGPSESSFPIPSPAWTPPPADEPERRFAVPWRWWDALLIFATWLFGSALLVPLALLPLDAAPQHIRDAVAIVVSVSLLAVLTPLWVYVRDQPALAAGAARAPRVAASPLRLLWGPKRATWRDIAWGALHGLIGLVAINGVLAALLDALARSLQRDIPQVQEGVRSAVQNTDSLPLVFLSVVLLSPFAEELLYRSVLYQGLRRRLWVWPAIGLSGLAFGLTHFEPLVIILTFPLGMYFAWTFHRRGTLWTPIVAHVVFNLSGLLLILAGVDS